MSQSISHNNKRIAKNMLFLYFRMFLVMGVTLFTSRIVLKVLGVTDFGLFNVIVGVVAMMGVLNGAMSSATNRFFAFELGRKDHIKLRDVFSMSLNIYILLCAIFLIIAETLGVWFVNAKLTIPANRLYASNVAFQFAIFSSISTLLMTPFNAAILAHEDMGIYAYVSIIEVLCKLGIVYLLYILPFDKLSTYSILLFIVTTFIALIYVIYCIKKYNWCKYHLFWNREMFRVLVSYSGWNLFGSIAALVKGQGLNILLNMFFTPAVNAARGVSAQIDNAVSQFSQNFYRAVRPQIIKMYAQNNLDNMFKLIVQSSKFSAFLLIALSLPLFIDTYYVIKLWLGQVPAYTVQFTRLMLLIVVIESMAQPLMTACHATGKVALYQIIVGTLILMNIPISYFLLKNGLPPLTVYIVSTIITIVAFYARMIIVKHLIPEFPCWKFNKESVIRVLLITLISAIPAVIYNRLYSETLLHFVIMLFICESSLILSVYFFGLKRDEQIKIINLAKEKIKAIF